MSTKQHEMILDLKYMNYQYGLNIDTWLKERSPKQKRSSEYWDEVHLEYDEVVNEFREFLQSQEQVYDKKGNLLSPLNIYILTQEYMVRIEKLMLIFNLKLYKTLNENKKTGIKYIVMRAFWIDHKGKNVRWFSKNLGPENKVLNNGNIPEHLLDSVKEYILYLMWDQYLIDYHGGDDILTFDADGNNIIERD